MEQQRQLLEQYNKNRSGLTATTSGASTFQTGREMLQQQQEDSCEAASVGPAPSLSSYSSSSAPSPSSFVTPDPSSKRARFTSASPDDDCDNVDELGSGEESDDSLDEIMNFKPFERKK